MVYGAAHPTGNTHQYKRKDAEIQVAGFTLAAESREQRQKNDS